MFRNLRSILWLLPLVTLAGCGDFDQTAEYSGYEIVEDGQRTLLVYLAMDNSLSGYANTNIRALRDGVSRKSLAKGRVLVYKDVGGTPLLLEVKVDKANKASVDTLKRYSSQDSADPAILRAVVSDVKQIAPGRSYGLVIGSHASGWLPPASQTQGTFGAGFRMLKAQTEPLTPEGRPYPLTRTLMTEGSTQEMTVAQFANAVDDGQFEFIVFDACYMAGVETVYALRNKAKWIVGSPAEIIANGMPYDLLVGDLMAPTPKLDAVCRKYYDYYNASYDRSATITLFDCSKMEALAAATAPVIAAYATAIPVMNVSSLQYFDRPWSRAPKAFFDLKEFIHILAGSPGPLVTAFDAALADAIVCEYHTAQILRTIPVNTCCGATSFIPVNSMGTTINNFYTQTDWAQRVYPD